MDKKVELLELWRKCVQTLFNPNQDAEKVGGKMVMERAINVVGEVLLKDVEDAYVKDEKIQSCRS